MDHDTLARIMSGEDRSARAAALRAGTTLLKPGYAAAVGLRNAMFNTGLRKPAELGKPTVSIGNLTTGGTGKTPMVIETVRRLVSFGQCPAVLLRGYGNDETRELREALGRDAEVEANPDRVAGANAVLARNRKVSCFVLDDGFQHRQVRRDLDIVLIDATNPFGFGHQLPRGLLRESPKNLRRADAVIVTRADQLSAEELKTLDTRIEQLHGKPPIAHTAHQWTALRDAKDKELPTDWLKSKRVAGVCGIGNPGSFRRTLETHAKEVARFITFDDHHDYQPAEIIAITHEDADAVVTTGKDWVKWKSLVKPNKLHRPVVRPVLGIDFLDGSDALDEKLRNTMS